VLVDSNSTVHPRMWQALGLAATKMNIALVRIDAGRQNKVTLPAAFDAAVLAKAGAILVLPDEPLFLSRRADIVALAARHGLPAFYGAREFVGQLRSVDLAVTGSPVTSYEASRLMEAAYFHGTLYALALAAGLAVVVLRRARETLLALTPLALGTLWTFGFMRAVGLSFNLANVWALPLIVGAAAEYGLNVVLRYREGDAEGRTALPRSTAMAVLLNGLTTIAGFGSLMIAHHQGIFGLGLLLTVGTAAGLGSSLLVLPVLVRFLRPAAPATIGQVDATRRMREGPATRRS